MALIHLAILLPLIAAIAIGVIYRYYKRLHLGWFVLPVPLFIVIYLLTLVPRVSSNQLIYESLAIMPRIGMNFDVYIDGLGLLFAILISGIGALVVLYSIGYLSHREDLGSFYIYLLMFMSAMLGLVLNDNVLMLYLFWELTSISSFLLIAFWFMKERSLYGAQKSMLITMGGGFLMLGGFILLYIMTGTFSIREMLNQVSAIQESPLAPLAVVLILFGAFTKSAQFPFYIWLPDAMEAPTPVSAYLHSATMVKAGIYLVARLTPLFAFSELWVWIILLGGLITMTWASFNAIRKDDLKAVLAFSTVSQLGLIMSLLGLGALSVVTGANEEYFSIAVVAAVFHLINHATFKGALFMVTGIVDHEAGYQKSEEARRAAYGHAGVLYTDSDYSIIHGGASAVQRLPFEGTLPGSDDPCGGCELQRTGRCSIHLPAARHCRKHIHLRLFHTAHIRCLLRQTDL